jgi:hypothetical protein
MRYFRRKPFGRISSHFSKVPLFVLAAEFLLVYLVIGTLFAFAYWKCCKWFPENTFTFNIGDLCLTQALYFSFITQLTVGYGDYTPIGYGQTLAVAQGILGVIIVGIWIGVVVAKWFTAGSRGSIMFAAWAGYSLKEDRFFVLFVNRRVHHLVDANINSIVKLSRYNPVAPGGNAPYIGKSAWPFSIQKVPVDVIAGLKAKQQIFPDKDGIKISISGTAGMTRCTNWTKYNFEEVWVFPDKNYYGYDKFENPRFDKEFYEEFIYPHDPRAVPFGDFDFASEVEKRRQIQQCDPEDLR